jgi:transposase
MGPVAVKSYPGKQLVHAHPSASTPAERAKQEIDYGRREKAGYVFGALQPSSGEVLTASYTRRTKVNWIDFLQQVEAWIPQDVERVYAVLDNLTMHRSIDVLLFNLAYPRWEFVFQPTCAAYLNLIEPWWKTLRSLALKGRRFETWQEVVEAVETATTSWNAHKHPYVWGRRRRHRPRRKPGIAQLPKVA